MALKLCDRQIETILDDESAIYTFTNPMRQQPLECTIQEGLKTFSRRFLKSIFAGQTCWSVYQNNQLLIEGLKDQ